MTLRRRPRPIAVFALAASGLATLAAAAAPTPPPPSPPPYETLFYTHDGLRLEAYLYRPAGPGPFPLVVYNHGSNPGKERIEWAAPFIGRLLTAAGYAVLVPERRGYGQSEGATFTEEIGDDRGPRYVARLQLETGDVLAAVDHVLAAPGSRLDPRRVAIMGWSFGGIVTTFAAGTPGPARFAAAVVQAPGALSWPRSPALQPALREAARRIRIPIQCLVAENDATVESTRAVCEEAHAAAGDLKVYPPFTPTPPRPDAQGHAIFSPQGLALWKDDVLAFLARHLGTASADLVVLNAKVLTVDREFRVAQAVAIRDGLFARIGTSEDARALAGPATRVIDAGGHTVIPGLIDSHVHALGVAEAETRGGFRDLRSIDEILGWVREKAAATPAGQWLWTPRVFPTRLAEKRLPTRAELDTVAPGIPVVVDAAYAFVLDTAALEAAGIGPGTAAPPGGSIVKDAEGRPTGLLRNVGAMLDRYQPPRRPERLLSALEDVHRRYNAAGITSVIERSADLAGYRAYEELRAQDRDHVRATVTLRVDSDGTVEGTESFLRALPLRFHDGDDRLRVGPLKIFADGGILAGTAYMREPYGPAAASLYGVADPGYRGLLTIPADRIRNVMRAGNRMGWQMCAHVTGDAGVDAVLDAFAAADADRSIRDRRFTLIHAYFPNPETARRAAALGVAVDTQPAWYYKDADALLPALGEARLRPFIGLQEWLRAGVKVVLNTDHMFGLDPDHSLNPYDPFLTMATAVTRRTEKGQVIGPEQAISREDALRMMTANAAWLSFEEDRKGSIEVGKLADLVVLSDDYLACPPERIKDIRAVTTVLGGKVVYEGAGAR